MKEICLGKGKVALVDDEDFETLRHFKWRILWNGYAARAGRIAGKKVLVIMHREILGLSFGDGRIGDHANGNPLDNRRSNLRICSAADNARNAAIRNDNTSGFKGVTKSGIKWRAYIKIKGTQKYLGTYESPEDAYAAYCAAAKEFHGDFARL